MLRRLSTGLVIAGALGAGVSGMYAQDASPHSQEQIERLLHGLAAADFGMRRESENELRSLGEGVLPRLRAVATTADLEVRYRVERIIADVERRALHEALERLDRGEEPENLDLVHGWERFREQLGNDIESRQLFAQVLRAEPLLIRAVDGPPDRIQSEFESRCADLGLRRGGQRRTTPGLATVAALLFVGGQPECRPSTVAANCINTMVQQGEFRTALNRSDPPEHLQLLLGQWIARSETATAMQRLSLAASFELTEGLDVAREMIRTRAFGPQIQYAVLYIAKVGGLQDLHLLEQLLGDDLEIHVGRRGANSQFTSQLQDVALAGLVHLTGQNLPEYGFHDELRPHPTFLFTPGTIGFPDESARTSALEQWRRWAGTNLRELHPDPDWAVEGVST